MAFPPFKGDGVRVGIIDSGVDYAHPDFGSCAHVGAPNCAIAGGWNFQNESDDPMDEDGHGTHVASIVASRNLTYGGVAPKASLYAYKVTLPGGQIYEPYMTAAMELASDPNGDDDLSDHLDVVNMSLGNLVNDSNYYTARAADNLVEAGTVVVAAAGNDGQHYKIGSPASAKRVVTVGAATYEGTGVSSYSSKGPLIDGDVKPNVVAPGASYYLQGQAICGARATHFVRSHPNCGDEQHVEMFGTSMASPHVAGMAALLVQRFPDMSPDEIRVVLEQAAVPLVNSDTGVPYDVTTQGHGMARLPDITQAIQRPLVVYLEKTLDDESSVKFRIAVRSFAPSSAGLEVHYALDIGRLGEGYVWVNSFPEYRPPQEWSTLTGSLVLNEQGQATFDLPIMSKASLPEGMSLARLRANLQDGPVSTDYFTFNKTTFGLTNPTSCDVQGASFEFKGSLSPMEGRAYRIDYAPLYSEEWTDEGVTLTNFTGSLHGHNVLGKFLAPEGMESGFYRFRLRILDGHGTPVAMRYFGNIRIDLGLKWTNPRFSPIFPVYSSPTTTQFLANSIIPSVGSISSDVGKELAFMTYASNGMATEIKRIDSSGKFLPSIVSSIGYYFSNIFSLLLGNFGPTMQRGYLYHLLEGNGQTSATRQGRALDLTGMVTASFEGPTFNSNLASDSLVFPIHADLNNDGQSEIVSLRHEIGNSSFLDVRNNNLELLPGWPVQWTRGTNSQLTSNPLIGNFDLDSDLEIALVSRIRIGDDNSTVLGRILNLDGTTVNEHWPQSLSTRDFFVAESVAADLNNDGVDELIVGLGDALTVYDTQSGAVYAEAGGPGWPRNSIVPYSSYKFFPASVGDIDGDGELEIVTVKGDPDTYNGVRVEAYNSDGSEVGDGAWPRQTVGYDHTGPLIADVNGNGIDDVVYDGVEQIESCLFGAINARDGLTGEMIEGFPKYVELGYSIFSHGKTLEDLESDGEMDLVATSSGFYRMNYTEFIQNFPAQRRNSIYAWSLGVPDSTAASAWNTARVNFGRTGRYSGLAAPTNLRAQIAPGEASLVLNWGDPGNGNKGSNYMVKIERIGGGRHIEKALSSSTHSYTFTNLTAGTYHVRVGSHMKGLNRFAWTKPLSGIVPGGAPPHSQTARAD